MKNPLKFWLGTLTVFLLALTPSVVPVGGSVAPAVAATVSESGGIVCEQTVDNATGVQVTKPTIGGQDYCVVTFTRVGTTSWTLPSGLMAVDYLVVGGGGAGGSADLEASAGGGGGGQVVEKSGQSVSANAIVTIVVGQGGQPTLSRSGVDAGNDGSSSSVSGGGFSVSARGGGGGANARLYLNPQGQGSTSGWTGGGGSSHAGTASNGSVGDGGSSLKGGNAHPNGTDANPQAAGGGGGAGGAGANAGANVAGNGGVGISSSISGSQVWFGGGGGGGKRINVGARSLGGSGVGGAGGFGSQGVAGVANTGGGGGGGTLANPKLDGGAGGSGVVILRYALEPPDAVTGFQLAAERYVDAGDDTDSVTLQWNAAAAQTPSITGYEIKYSTNSDMSSATTVAVSGSSTTSREITGLTDGATYYFEIYAKNANDQLSTTAPRIVSRALSAEDHALSLDGALSGDSIMRASGSSVIPSSGNFTVEAWIKPVEKNGCHTIVYQGTSNWDRFAAYYCEDRDRLHVARDGRTDDIPVGDLTGHWSHIALSVHQSTNEVSAYLNGALLDTTTLAGNDGSDDSFYIGVDARNTGYVHPFGGEIDQVKIWEGVLTQPQIEDSMHSWDDTDVTGSPSLISHYDFNDPTQSTVLRDMHGSNDLTVSNAETDDFSSLVETPTREGYDVYKFSRSYLTATGGWTVPSGVNEVDYLIVAGGGGGGGRLGGGGGAGGLLQDEGASVTAGNVLSIVVGAGGRGGAGDYNLASGDGSNGGDSSALSLTAKGGGGGGGTDGRAGKSGGSGGGAGRWQGANGGLAESGQGNSGGESRGGADRSGGGGGAGASGATGAVSGNGGVGLESSITGVATFYAGGGGGSAYAFASGSPQAGTGGSGGGGNASRDSAGSNGIAATGGGGGGGGYVSNTGPGYPGGDGGSGIIVFAAPDATISNSLPSPIRSRSGSTATLTVDTTGSRGELSFQWQVSTDGGSNWSNVSGGSGATTSSFTTPTLQASDHLNKYRVQISSSINGTTASATSRVTTLSLSDYVSLLTLDNGHSGSSSSIRYGSGDSVTLPSPTRTGYVFDGWFTSSSGGVRVGGAGDTFSPLEKTDLVLRYELDDPDSYGGSGSTLSDTSGLGTLGATMTGTTFSSSDVGYLEFDGTDDHVVTGNLRPRVSDSSDVSLFMWVYPTDNGVILSELGQTTINDFWHVSLIELVDGDLKFRLWILPEASWITHEDIELNTWHYVGLTYSGTTLRAFVNGVQVGPDVTGFDRYAPWEHRSNYGLHYAIGVPESTNMGDGTRGHFRMGSFHVHKSGLSNAQVETNYQATCERFDNNCSGRTLYAQWTPETYTVTFNKGSASGSTGVDRSATKTHAQNLVLPDSATASSYFSRSGYSIVAWSENADGSTSDYALGANYTAEVADTLYPVWSPNSYTLTLDDDVTTVTQTVEFGSNPVDPASTRSNLTLVGWSDGDDSDAEYAADLSDYTMPASNDTLYAVWKLSTPSAPTVSAPAGNLKQISVSWSAVPSASSYTVKVYNSSDSLVASVVSIAGTSTTITSSQLGSISDNTEYRISVSAVGTGNYATSTESTKSVVTTNTTYAITWDVNGGTLAGGEVATFVTGGTVAEPSDPSRSGFDFVGWSTSEASGNGVLADRISSWPYTPGVTSAITLYAIWDSTIAITTPTSGLSGTFDESFSLTLATSGGPGGNSFGITTGTLPSGLSLDSSSGEISGTPSATGDSTIVVTVTDSSGATAVTTSFTLSISAKTLASASAPTVSAPAGELKQLAVSWSAITNASSYTLRLYSASNTLLATVSGVTGTSRTLTTSDYSGLADDTAYTVSIQAIGTGNYASGAESLKSASVTTNRTYTVTWDSNGGSSVSSATFVTGGALAAPNNPTRTGYAFVGWSTTETSNNGDAGTAVLFDYTPPSAADFTLYARWSANTNTVTFKANFSGGPSDATQSVVTDQATNLNTDVFTREGHTFVGWDTQANGAGTDYSNGQSVTLNGDLTLYAEWTISTYTITYSAGDNGSGTNVTATKTHGVTLVLPDSATANGYFTRTGFTVSGWSTNSDGSTTDFALGANFTTNAADTLYPVWSVVSLEASEDTYVNSGSGGNTNYGTNSVLLLKNAVNSITNSFNRVAYAKFEFDPSLTWNGGILELAVTGNNSGGGSAWNSSYTTFNVNVYGAGDASWSESTLTFNAADSSTQDWGIDTSSWPWVTNGAEFLGTISIPTSESTVGNTYGLSTAELDNFLNGDADGAVTLFFVRSDTDNRGNLSFASSENTSYAGPTLKLSESGYTYTIAYDINGGTGSLPAPGTFTDGSGTDYTIATPSSVTAPANKEFTSWNTKADGSGTSYDPGDTYNLSRSVTLYAQFSTVSFTVTYAAGDNGSGASRTATKTSGVNLTLPNSATANSYFTRAGHTVTAWSVNADGSTSDFALGGTYSTEAADTLYPVWTIDTYAIVFGSGDDASGSNESATKTYNVTFTIPNSATSNTYFSRTGYTITSWSTNSDGSTSDYDFGDSYTTNAALTLYPVWTADTYTITFAKGSVSGSTGSNQTATKTHDIALTLPNSATANGYFTKTGYTVVGWSVNADGSTTDFALGASYATEAADTLYPVWEPNDYTVTYTYNGATGGNSVSSIVYTVDGILVSLPTPTRAGFTFEGWHSDSGLTTRVGLGGASYTPAGDITLYAKWDAGTYTVIFEYNGATSGNSDEDDTYTTGGTAITLPTPSRTGYTFGGWYSDSGLTTSVGAGGASFTPTLSRTIYAKWTAITRSVTYDDTNASAGSVPVDGASYIIGDTVVVKANSGSLRRTGFTFDGWTVAADGSGTVLNAGSTVTVATSDITLYPKWSPITYSISYNLNGGTGDVSGAPTSWQTATSNVSLPTSGITKTGFTFDGWQELGSTTKVNNSYQPNYEDVTLVARWIIKSINYTFDEGDASGLSIAGWPSDASANFGTTITLPDLSGTTVTISSVSYVFFGWQSGGTTYNSGDSFVLGDSPPTFTAQWARLFDVRYGFGGGTHSLTGNQDPECDTAGLCVDGESITLRTSPERPGYTFDGWKVQDTNVVKGASAPHVVTSLGYLFYAQWTAVDYQFTFNSMGGSQNPTRVENSIGELVTMPSPGTRTGYTFAGWSPDGGSTLYITGSTYVVGVGGQAFIAQWVPDVYTVTYDWQGGAGSTPKVSDAYTVGTGDMTLPTASSAGYTRDGFTFSGWSTSIGGSVVSGFRPTADDILYAVWADGNYTLTYDTQGGSVIATTASIARTTSTILATPTRSNFTHVGWFTSPSGGTKVGDAGDTYTPSASTTVYARWVQDSLYGVDLATLETGATFTASNSTATDTNMTHDPSGTSARIQIPTRSLPAGTVVTVRYFKETARQSDLIPGDNSYFFALLVSWLLGSGTSATVPDTDPNRPITVTLTNSNIKAGAMVYQVIGTQVTELGRATADGTVTVELFTDPEIVVAATAPSAPTSVSGTSGDTRATVSWTAGSSGGSPITGYTVTASPGGATCSTASTSCTIGSLTNNTAYTFTVRATNALGTSSASSASSPVTPVGANYTVTFDSNGGSAVSDGSFFSGSTVSAPTSPSRSGFTFRGWSTVQDDATTAVTFPYAPGVTSPITLYALWQVAPPAPVSGSSGGGPITTPGAPTRRPSFVAPRVLGPTQPVVPPRPFVAPVVIAPERGFDPDAGSQARVGGLPATVTKTTPAQGGVSIGVGRVQVGITPTTPQPSGPAPIPGRSSDVSVSAGQSATVSGGGLLPGSQLQVWLPGLRGDAAKELARIPVKTDGTFESELTFSARQSDTPVPLGRQVIQVTGFDELGNQTIVDMTITIGQGDPSPEPNRTVNALPDLAPGQSLATSAGVPELVTIEARPDSREVAVVSGEWNFTVSLPDDAGQVEQVDSGATIRLVQAKTATVSGEGFQPDTRVDIWLFSDPTLLGSATVLADGSFTGEVFLDSRYAVIGEHTLQLQGVGVDGFIKAANLGVVVEEPLLASADNDSSIMFWVVGVALLIAFLSAAILFIRRRQLNR